MSVDAGSLTELQLDALREVGNIGAGHAATALAELLGEEIEITVPKATIIATVDLPARGDDSEAVVAAVLFEVTSEAGGIMMYVFREAEARAMADRLLGMEPGTTQEIGEMERSVVGEVGNILTGSFTTALAGFTNLEFDMSPPMVAVDSLATILSEVSVTAAALGDFSLEMDTSFIQAGGQLEGRFFYLMDEHALTAILQALGMAE